MLIIDFGERNSMVRIANLLFDKEGENIILERIYFCNNAMKFGKAVALMIVTLVVVII